MPTRKLTQAAVDRLPPPTDKINETHWDSLLPGFGLRISSKNRRTWIALYRVGGKSVMETLSTMAVTREVGVARALARASMTKARSGVNPVEEKRQKEAADEAAAQAAKKTFAWLVEHKDGDIRKGYLPEYAERNQRPSTLYETRRMLARAMPFLGDKIISEIKRSDVTELLDAVAAKRRRKWKNMPTGPNAEARTIQVCLNSVFRWAMGEDHLAINPMAAIPKNRHGKLKSRNRYLSTEEIKAFWSACDQLGWPYGVIGQLLLLSGQRIGEVSGMRWDELQEEGRWSLPEHRTKNARAHVVYLSPQAQQIINSVPRVAGSDFLFSVSGRAPVTGFPDAKQKVDSIMGAKLDRPLLHWVWHDLRRTAVTGMGDNRVAPHVIEAVVNHISGSKAGVAGVYNKAVYAEERQAAMEAWGSYIDRLLGRGPDNNVVALVRA